jgi:uncharacterized protein
MNRICQLRCILILVLLVALLPGVLPVEAQSGYPARADPYVNDFASLLTTEHTTSLRSLFSELKTDNGVEIVVVTLDSIHDYATGDASIESFGTNLFNTWGIGTAQKNDGVLILVAWKDREVRIEVGAGYGDSLNADMQTIIDEQMIPAFRREDYSQGIYDGARAVSRRLITRSGQAAATQAAPARVETVAETPASAPSNLGSTLLVAASLVGGASVAAFGAGQYMRYHKRRCPNCQTTMIRLDEVSDDVHLDSGQKVEELLQSVDYDVWKCPTCNFHTLQGYKRWSSSFGQCPECNYRTLKTDSRAIAEPTYVSTGTKLISQDCRHCKYHNEDKVILPMLTLPEETEADETDSSDHSSSHHIWSSSRSSSYHTSSRSHSSSSHSSSGGRSHGGGASGKW